jgi:O-acetylhomoserine/O-acetylserine sulfhydrylase
VAKLEDGIGAVATASGHAAQFLAITSLARSGDNIVSSPFLYGGSHNQFKVYLPRLGINVNFTKDTSPEEYKRLIDGKTKAIYVETIGNPHLAVPDFEALAAVAHDAGVPLIVDNTFGACGYLFRPLTHGADIVVQSATKWLGGHGTTIGGVVVDGGTFDWGAHPDRFPEYNGLSDSYHGLNFWKLYGRLSFTVKLRTEGLRDLGASMNPFGAFLLLQGLETLSVRLDRIVLNTLQIAQWLENEPHVSWVSYPGE